MLTEAANGHFIVTPLLAALAGAEVIALARDSQHGSAADVRDATERLAREWGVHVRVSTERTLSDFGRADVITNLGAVRPIDRRVVDALKPTAVVPLMWETWEFRPADLDLGACLRRGIVVLGTNEHAPGLGIFDFVGVIPVKMAFELGLEVSRTSVLVLGSGEFMEVTEHAFRGAGSRVRTVDASTRSLAAADVADIELLVLMDPAGRAPLIGPDAAISWHELARIRPDLCVAHVCGSVDADELAASGLRYRPERIAPPGSMSATTAYVGPLPVVRLHAAGLRVGQALARARLGGASVAAAIERAMSESPAMRFAPEQIARATVIPPA